MLPTFLQSSYKTYKEDTNVIATWLAHAAKKCGYSADLLDHVNHIEPPRNVQPAGRLKGKARKQAKQASKSAAFTSETPSGQATQPEAPQPEVPIYTIKIKEFITLAEYIVSTTKPLLRVPASVVKALDRAIVLRKEHGAEAEASDAPDEGHAHFLGVLEKTRDVLRSRSPTETIKDRLARPANESDGDADPKGEDLVNRFGGLDFQEPSQEFVDAPDVKPATKHGEEPQPKYEVEPFHAKEEEYFAALCLFEDVREIRKFLSALWATQYKEGMDLCAISITVDTAIGFVRTLEQDFVRIHPTKTDFKDIVDIFFAVQCLIRGEDPSHIQQQGDPCNMAVYDLAEELMIPTWSILSSLQEIIEGDSALRYNGKFGWRELGPRWSQREPRDKVRDDRLNLMEIFPDFILLAKTFNKPLLAEDELLRGIGKMSPGKDIPLWLVFAMQCYLDAQHVLGDNVRDGYNDLKNTANSIRASIEQNLEFHQNLKIPTWPKKNDEYFADIQKLISELVEKDVIGEIQRRVMGDDSESFQLLKQHPVLCGLQSYKLKMRYQAVSIGLVNAWGSIMYSAQLYNAIRQEKLLPQIWKDMELLISLHGQNAFFVGDPPKGLEEYLRRFTLSMGFSATMLAANRRKNDKATSSKGPRRLYELCAVGQLFKGRYGNNDNSVSWTPETIKPIIDAKVDDSDSDQEATKKSTTKTPSKGKKIKQSRSGSLFRRPKFSGALIPTIDFLLDIAMSLHAEAMEMSFDYLRVHRFCWVLLRFVNEACKPGLLDTFSSGYLQHEYQLPWVVGYIFIAASAVSKIGGPLIPRRAEVQVSSKLLTTAAQCVEKMIDCDAGAIEIKMLREVMGIDIEGLEDLDNEI